jgi:UDP-2,3-diacylglucosamine hydrolase
MPRATHLLTTLFVSDLHLDAGLPQAGAQFSDFLLRTARAADALYILGDLFETWIGDDDDESHHAEICAALGRLASTGVPCYVMHGNRDFLLRSGFEARSGCRLLPDPTIIDLYGERALLTHGDLLCTGDLAYQRLRGIVRSPGWQRRFLRLPLSVRRQLAAQARAGSQRHIRRAQPQIMDVDAAAVLAAMRAAGVRTLIHGHTHRPAIHRLDLDGCPARRIVLGAWYEQGSYLAWSPDSGPVLATLPAHASPVAGDPSAGVPNESAAARPVP